MATTDTQQAAQFSAEAAVSAAEAKQYLIEAQQGYQDTSAAAQEAKDAAAAAATSEQNATYSEANAAQSAAAAVDAKADAEAAASSASDYAKNKFTFYKTASDPDGTIAGLAATTDGQSFWVAQGPDALSAAWQYQNKAGVAVLQAKQPGTSAITGTIREFPTLATAQADADAGNIPVGSTAYYRSSDDSALAVEVINNAGTLQPTGRKMPSQAAVEAVSESLTLQIGDIGDRQIEIQRKIDGFSSSVFDSSANDLLIALTDALGRRTWLEADLRGRPSPYSVRLLREVLPDLLTGILFDSERYGLSAAITDSAGRRTWLEADMEGKPSARSAELIGGVIADYLPQSLIDALVDLLAPLISGEPRPIATALSTARQGAKREYPTLTKPLTAPVFSKSDQAAISIYWPWLFDATVIGVNKIYLYYSTDHAANHADSGIYLASADDISGPWTQHGRVYRDDVSGEQSETPSVVWDEKNNRMVMYYQQAGVGTGQQSTLWATSTDGFNWVRQGIATQMMSTGQPGDGHTGYFKPFRFAGSMYGYSLYGGTDRGRYAIWRGSDFGTWTPDPRLIGKMPDKCMNLPQYENGWFPKIFVGDVINWNGSPWWIGLVGPSTAGGGSNAHRICAAPLREDLRNLSANVVDITPAEQAWENGVIDYFGNFLTWKGKMYGVYRANTGQG
ncbi:hypothetical protein M2T00_10500, partial [Klebsiella pneumoniae]|nr:hypothetical protein [Klebsiella pneumoniae]